MAISTLAEISYIFILAGLEPKLIVFQSGTQQQSCRARKIGVICHQDRPSICICSKARDRTMTALQLAPEWWRAANGGFLRVWLFSTPPIPQRSRPAGVDRLLLHLDNVISLCVVTHIEAVKHLNLPTISTAYHSPALIKKTTRHSTKNQP